MKDSIKHRVRIAVILAATAPAAAAGRAEDTSGQPVAIAGQASAQQRVEGHLDRAALANWGVSGRVVSGKIPTLNITVEQRKLLAAWPQIRAAGLVEEAGNANWAQTHTVTICKDVALAVAPIILHDLYREDDALDYAPVYVFLALAESEKGPELMFSVNVNRAIVRKLSAAPPGMSGLGGRADYTPWLEAHLQQEQHQP